MEANSTRNGTGKSNNTQGPTFCRLPVEIWCRIFHHAVTSSLFPYSEDGSSSLSILHDPYLYGAGQDGTVLLTPYLDHTTYANQQRHITHLRQVCRRWNDILEQYITPRYQWMFTGDDEFIYPPPSRRPHLMVISQDRRSCSSSINVMSKSYNLTGHGPTNGANLILSRHGLVRIYPHPSLTFPEQDLSQVKIAVFGRFSAFEVKELPSRCPLLQSLTLDVRCNGFTELLHIATLMNQLTHLSLAYFIIQPHMDFENLTLYFPNVRYLAIHFGYPFREQNLAFQRFPRWRLKRLTCLSIAGFVPLEAEETLSDFFGGLSTSGEVTDLLLDFNWLSGNAKTSAFWRKMWSEWFPHLTVLGVPQESLGTVTSSLLSARSSILDVNTTARSSMCLYILLNRAFGSPQESHQAHYEFDDALEEVYRAGYLERIYLPDSHTKEFARCLVDYCLKREIPVYNVEGWQIYQSLP
ncbi:hypothetical protein CPB86DRAFT_872512 [Serendipita vermifera]|nr:hypothetical protein CPB86DRAFT_872512 [Serendipita vermifera]